MRLYVRAENQDGRIYELVCDGENQPIPSVGDRIETSYIAAVQQHPGVLPGLGYLVRRFH